MDASEEVLGELFNDVDAERSGVVDLETFLAAVERQLSSDGLRCVCTSFPALLAEFSSVFLTLKCQL